MDSLSLQVKMKPHALLGAQLRNMPTQAPKIVVIGAGMGGLSAAIRLAHRGCDVTVIDRAPNPGGKMRTRPSPAGPVDCGPTVMTLRPIFEELFADVGAQLSAHVTLHREEVLARHWWADGGCLDLFADPEASAAAVASFAGAEAEAQFRAFCARAARLYAAFEGPILRAGRPRLPALVAHVMRQPALIGAMAPHRTLAQSLRAQFTDPRLAQLFGRYATYVGGSPFRSPAVLGLIWHAESQGVWRVEGGMHALARAMGTLAEAQGASLRLGLGATRIEVQGGRAVAVHLEDGQRLPADAIVFNGDPRALSQGLLGPPMASALPQEATEPRSLSAWVWAFAAEPHGAPLVHHNVFFAVHPEREFGPIAAGRMPEDPTLYVCAQDRGAGCAPAGLERFEIIMNGAPVDDGADPTDEEIDTCRKRTFETLARFGLTFDPRPGAMALITPRHFAQDFPASAGSLYGRSPHGMMAAFQRPTARLKVPGVYLAGGGAHPGAGIPMATLSGAHAAAAILTDLASPSMSRQTATRGGMSTA